MDAIDDAGALAGGLEPLAGGFSGETFVATAGEERTVVRIYGARSAWRGPRAPEVDAAVMALVRGLVPVPDVLEARPGDPEADVPGLLVTSLVPGERLDLLLPALDEAGRATVGERLGTLLGRLSHVAMPRPGMFAEPTLALDPMPVGDLVAWADRLGLDLPGLSQLLTDADDLNALVRRSCLVHSDFNPKNLLVDPDTLEVTALLDWEYAHSGNPFTDLGNLLRFEEEPGGDVFVEAVLSAYRAFVPDAPPTDELVEHARAADLYGLVDLAARAGENPIADRALVRLTELAAQAAG